MLHIEEVSALALDRQAIEKKDFPIARRGYEPEAVDIHLEALAGEVERLQIELDSAQRSASSLGAPPPPPPGPAKQSLALAASEQVRMIVEAAESSAADIERSAQEEAARIRADADAEARRTRDDAVERSQDHVGSVSEATSTMLQRVDAMENELGALVDSLRTGTNRLTADLSLLQGNMGELYGAAGSAQAPVAPEPVAPPPALVIEEVLLVEPELDPEPMPEVEEPGLFASTEATEAELEPEPVVPEPEPVALEPEPPAPDPEPFVSEPAAAAPANDGDVEGARLIALNMALNGQSRDETDKYLRDNFDLGDRAGLLDEVYATVEG